MLNSLFSVGAYENKFLCSRFLNFDIPVIRSVLWCRGHIGLSKEQMFPVWGAYTQTMIRILQNIGGLVMLLLNMCKN